MLFKIKPSRIILLFAVVGAVTFSLPTEVKEKTVIVPFHQALLELNGN